MDDLKQKEIFSKNLLHYVGDVPQSTIAKAIGVSPQTFNTWCQCKAIPRAGKLQALADYFNINKSDLIEDHSQEKPATQMNEKQAKLEKLIMSLDDMQVQAALNFVDYLHKLENNSDDQ